MLTVSTSGGPETIWHTSGKGRWIHDRIALSRDGGTVAFARSPGAKVYVLREPGAAPRVIADVDPDSHPRQIRTSDDGRWVAFTASRLMQSGMQGRVHANLYVAAASATVLRRAGSALNA